LGKSPSARSNGHSGVLGVFFVDSGSDLSIFFFDGGGSLHVANGLDVFFFIIDDDNGPD
jgi:hypothetical protein